MADLTGPNPDEVQGGDARDAAVTMQPLLTGARASTAVPSAVSADNDSVDLWATRNGALNVVLRDVAGTAITTGVQYIEDVALGAVGTAQGTLIVGRAAAAAPTSVSADADAVGLWASRFGALNIIQRDTAGAALPAFAALADNTANPTTWLGGSLGLIYDGTTWDRLRSTDALDGSAALTTVGVQAVGVGPGFARRFDPAALTTVVNDASTVDVNGATTVGLSIGTSRTGTFVIEASADPGAWVGIGAWESLNGAFIAAGTGIVPASNSQYIASVAGYRQVRIRVATTLSGTVAHKFTLSLGDALPSYISQGFVHDGTTWRRLLSATNLAISGSTAPGIQSVALRVFDGAGSQYPPLAVPASDALAAANGIGWGTPTVVYNGATWDRRRGVPGATGAAAVGGLTASDAVLAAAPVTTGGRASTAVPTAMSGDGDVVDLWLSRNGAANAIPRDTAGAALTTTAAALADAFANPTVGGGSSFGLVYNGTTWDRIRTASADALAAAGLGAAALMGYNGTTWDRLRALTSADNLALGIALNVNSFNLGYDGTNSDLLRVIAALDAAPNVDTGILAVGGGPGWDRKRDPAGVAATSTANAVTVVVDGADVLAFHVTTIGVTPGSMIIEQTTDDTNWATAGAVMKLGAESWVQGSFVPAVNDVYLVRTTGIRQVRYRVNAVYASGTATVKVTGSVGAAMVKTIDVAPAPHNIGFPITSKTAQYTTTQTGVALWTPATGKRIVITSYQVQVGGTTAGTFQLWFGASGDTAYTRGTDLAIFDGEFAPSATAKPGVVQTGVWVADAIDRVLRVTDSAAINPLTVTVWGYETV